MTTRFNLVCNGMMLFNEVDDQMMEIVIPTEGRKKEHIRAVTASAAPTKAELAGIPKGEYVLGGVTTGGRRLIDLVDPSNYVVLKKARVAFDRAAALVDGAIIKVPKPDIIRLFRASEPDKPIRDILGNCFDVVHGMPRILHDIVVLSYREIPAGAKLKIDGLTIKAKVRRSGKFVLETQPLEATTRLGATINWMFYSNDRQPTPPRPHPTTPNDFLKIDNLPTTLALSKIGPRDLAAEAAIGIGERQFRLFHEMPDGDSVRVPASGRPGCSGLFRVD